MMCSKLFFRKYQTLLVTVAILASSLLMVWIISHFKVHEVRVDVVEFQIGLQVDSGTVRVFLSNELNKHGGAPSFSYETYSYLIPPITPYGDDLRFGKPSIWRTIKGNPIAKHDVIPPSSFDPFEAFIHFQIRIFWFVISLAIFLSVAILIRYLREQTWLAKNERSSG